MRILIDGMDLSGKTTLARRLTRRLEAQGLRVHHTRLTLHGGFHACFARQAYRRLPPGSLLCAWSFAAATLMDRLFDLVAPLTDHDVHIHEAHAAHTVAYAAGFGHHRTAGLLHALRTLWPTFDHQLLLTAHPATRQDRLTQRDDNDANDLLLVTEPARFADIDRRLQALLVADGATVIETDHRSPTTIEQLALTVLGREPTATYGHDHGPMAPIRYAPPHAAHRLGSPP